MDKGGKNSDGTRVETASRNRSFKRDSKGNLVSETSARERKKKTSKA
jgi:YD repeat-containing protein